MDVQNLHGCTKFTWMYKIYMDVQNLHGCKKFIWMYKIYMDVQNLHGYKRNTFFCDLVNIGVKKLE